MSNDYSIKHEALTPDEKSIIRLERFSQVPVFETWDGLIDINQILAPDVDDLTLMHCRHPWAAGWYLKEDAANSILNSFGASGTFLSIRSSAVIGEVAQVACMRPFRVGHHGNELFGAKDERLIFECIVTPEEGAGVELDWFVGFAVGNADAFLGNPELIGTTTDRFGFAINGDSNIYGIIADTVAGEVTANHDLTNTATTRYLKAVYNIGTDVNFFVDSTNIGTLTTRLPSDTAGAFLFFMYTQTTEVVAKKIRNYAVRLRWQNGATP